MDKNYCAVNTKYYKNNNVGEIDHVLRNMNDNVNAIDFLSENNFGFSYGDVDIKKHYENKLDEARLLNKKCLQKDSNTFIDSVLIFDSKKFNECLKDNKQEEIKDATKNYMDDFKKRFGFEPIGFEFHLDEGTVIDVDDYSELNEEEQKKYIALDNEEEAFITQYIKNNYHAHAIFLNYDFERNKSCLRTMTKENWSESQDLLYKHFKKFGFDRGEKKQTSKRDHKSKEDYVRELELKTIELIENHSKNLQEKDQLLDQIIDHQNDIDRFENLGVYAEKIKDFILDFKEKHLKITEQILKLPGAEEVKNMAINIYNALTKKTDVIVQENILVEEVEIKKTTDEIKIDNVEKEKKIKEKQEKIKNMNNRRKHSRASKPTLKPKSPKPE